MTALVRIIINGKEVPRTQVSAWERRRALAVLKKLGAKPVATDLPGLQRQLLERKLELGADGVMRLLRRELTLSDRMAAFMAWLSRGSRALCVTEIEVGEGSAEQVLAWYEAITRANEERPLLGATPDHYRLHTHDNGIIEVVETTGGSPLAARFFIDLADTAGLRTPVDPDFPVQMAGVARTASGVAIGGVRHQFRNEKGGGFRARLTVEFPSVSLPWMISGHQWHLASEFASWFEAALAAGR